MAIFVPLLSETRPKPTSHRTVFAHKLGNQALSKTLQFYIILYTTRRNWTLVQTLQNCLYTKPRETMPCPHVTELSLPTTLGNKILAKTCSCLYTQPRETMPLHAPHRTVLAHSPEKPKLALRPKIHGYTACKRTGFVKPDSVKLAMGHLLHDEAAPCNHALQTPVPPWIQGLVCQLSCIGWSVAIHPLSATAVPLHLTQFAVPFVQIVATVCLQGT